MNKLKIEKAGKKLLKNYWIFGHLIKMQAVKILAANSSANALPHLITAMELPDKKVASIAKNALNSLKDQKAIDALCDIILKGREKSCLTEIVKAAQYRPFGISRRCLFYIFTEQVEKYFELDYEFEHLRAEYMAASETMQQRIRNAIQKSNDNRFIGFFGELRKKIVAKELTEREAELILDVFIRNKSWEDAFALLFFAPLAFVPNIIDRLKKEKYKPQEVDHTFWNDLIAIRESMGTTPIKPDSPNVSLGPVFAKWYERGRNELKSKNANELREMLENAPPPDAIPALAALITQNLLTNEDVEYIESHPHWLVRMAYIAWGKHHADILLKGHSIKTKGGGEFWLEQSPALLGQYFLQLRAVALTPDNLQQLNTATEKYGNNTPELKQWAKLLALLCAYNLRNTITINTYEKIIEEASISIEKFKF